MKVSIITMAYNGYERFIPQYLKYVARLEPKPEEIILVLSKGSILKGIPQWIKIVESEATNMGEFLNDGIKKATGDVILSFPVDDELLKNAIREIQAINADVITLKYYLNDKVCDTPKMKKERIKYWRKYYLGASGYLAFKKQYVENNDFWKYPLLFKTIAEGKTIKSTKNPCVIWHQRGDGHGSGQNCAKATREIEEYANRYLSK